MKELLNKKYLIYTYGCQMNVHESEKIAGILEVMGMNPANDNNDADYIIFNTCCIREGAEDKAFGNIMALKPLKKANNNLKIIVCGCIPQQVNDKYNIIEKLKIADIIIGTHNINNIDKYILKHLEIKKRIVDIQPAVVDRTEILNSKRDNFVNAYVNITYGCNNFCTYCIVPFVRGRERSRDLESIIDECISLIKKGYKYITLLGQNVNSYGNDLNANINFPKLLKAICALPGDFKVKFMTSHPKDLSDELIDVIANEHKMAKVVHLPVQSGSDKILKIMNRNYTIKKYQSIIDKLKIAVPGVAISTDIIVGFPGETDTDFLKTYKLVEKNKYSQLFAYMYSKRSGTPAANFENQIADDEKNKRVNQILSLHKQQSIEINKCFIGNIYSCLSIKTNILETEFGRKVFIDKQLEINKFYNIKIVDYKDKIFIGKIV